MGMQGLRRLVPAVVSVVGVLALSGTAAGVDVGPVSAPGAGELVPPSQLPPTPAPPPVSAPTPPAQVVPRVKVPPVQVPAVQTKPPVPKLQTPTQLQSAPRASSPPAAAPRAPGSTASAGSAAQGVSTRGTPRAAGSGPAATAGSQPRPGAGASTRRQRLGEAVRDRRLRRVVEDLSGCLSSVPRFDAAVLALRAGLGDRAPRSRSQTARRLNTSAKRVAGAERRGVRGLKDARRRGACGAGATESGAGGGPTGRKTGVQRAASLAARTVRERGDVLGVTRSGGSANSDGTRPDRPEAGTRGSSAPPPPSSTPPRPSRASGPSDGSPVEPGMAVALLLGLATLGLLVTTALGRGLPTPTAALSKRRERPGSAARASTLLCEFCQSSHVAVNSREGVYRCARCGFGGTLTGADAPGLGEDGSALARRLRPEDLT